MRASLSLCLLSGVLLAACGQGGRGEQHPGRASDTSPDAAESEPQNRDAELIPAPLGSPLVPTGLAYRVDTILGQGSEAIRTRSYGINGLSMGVDVDADPASGNLLGADIQLRFRSAFLQAELEVQRIDGNSAALPLKLEVSVVDPRNLLGLPGLLGLVNPELRVALGLDTRDSDLPARYLQQLTVLDAFVSFLPRFTKAAMTTELEDAPGAVDATLALYSDRSGQRFDGLDIRIGTQPATGLDIQVELAPDQAQSSAQLQLAQPGNVDIRLRSYEGGSEQALSERLIELQLEALNQAFAVTLQEAEDVSDPTASATRYRLSVDQPLALARLNILDQRQQLTHKSTQAQLQPLPRSLQLCSGRGGACGSNGTGTDTSFELLASAPSTINLQQSNASGSEQLSITDFSVQTLRLDAGSRSGGKRGYVFLDTDGQDIHGHIRRVDGGNGLALLLSPGTYAQDRYAEIDNYIFIKNRRGSMRCPGRHSLDIRASGRWYDADFVLDALCQ